MKYRRSFVTNSSSSAFIVSFKDKDAVRPVIESKFTGDSNTVWSPDSKYKDQLINNILASDHRYNKDTVIKAAEEDIHLKTWTKLVNLYTYGYKKTYTETCQFLESDDGKKLIDAECKLAAEHIQEAIGEDQYVALIEHSHDSEDGVIEYNILPSLSCTKAIFTRS